MYVLRDWCIVIISDRHSDTRSSDRCSRESLPGPGAVYVCRDGWSGQDDRHGIRAGRSEDSGIPTSQQHEARHRRRREWRDHAAQLQHQEKIPTGGDTCMLYWGMVRISYMRNVLLYQSGACRAGGFETCQVPRSTCRQDKEGSVWPLACDSSLAKLF